MSEFREKIKRYLELKTNLDIAARRVINEKRDIHVTAKDYGLQYTILQRKVNILRRLYDYDEECLAYDMAITNVMYGHKTVAEAAKVYKLNPETITKEISKHKYLLSKNITKGPYEYDNFLVEGRVFTFQEELSLLSELRQWKYKSPLPCTCLICAMERLPSLAYQFAKKKYILYPQTWDTYMQADEDWLVDFEMAHNFISKLYPHYKNNVQELYETCKNKQQFSLLFDETNIFKVPECPSSSQMFQNNGRCPTYDNFKRMYNQTFDETTTKISQNTPTVFQNFQKTSELLLNTPIKRKAEEIFQEETTASFVTDQFKNTPLNLTNNVEIASNYDISQKENIDSSRACNQKTSELLLNTPIKLKSEEMFQEETASASFVTDQFKNMLLDVTNNVEIANNYNISQEENFDSSRACNQKTNEILLNTPMKRKAEEMFQEETASDSFVTDQFKNTPLNLTNNVEIASNYNISQKENFDSSRACNQKTSELLLNTPIKLKSEEMFQEETASASFVTDQFKNTLLDVTNNVKIASNYNISQEENFDLSRACNQKTSELRDCYTEWKSKVIFKTGIASVNSVTYKVDNALHEFDKQIEED
ncbi:unnamed protein product [Lasius platythorax]|uniref:Uncharacterized protein n=1 Tax=Lasius platythorax TaxID=488582 RepID=A0AAV2NPD5_9HYME